MAFLIGGANSLTAGYDIANSCRFNDDDDAYLTVTGSSTTSSGKTFTLSVWVKRSKLGAEQYILHARSADSQGNFARLHFNNTDTLRFRGYSTTYLETDALYRDVSAWYHIVLAVDTDTSGDGNSCRLYVNGSEVTSFSTDTNPSTDDDLVLGSDRVHFVGISNYGASADSEGFDGYMADLYLIDGQQLTPSSFGESDEDSGIWKPKEYTGSFGGNGFFLEFKESAVGSGSASTIGADTSGNTNHLTSSGIAVTDQTTDTPTNNFCTMNPLYSFPTITFLEGNLQTNLGGTDDNRWGTGTMWATRGKWYYECKLLSDSNYNSGPGVIKYGIDDPLHTEGGGAGSKAEGWIYLSTSAGDLQNGGPQFGTTNSATTNDILMVAYDLDNGKIWIGKGGSWNDGDPAAGSSPPRSNLTDGIFAPAVSGYAENMTFNFGNPAYANSSSVADANGYGAFEYTPPSGFYALCTKNLAEFG